jgi:hypothetical protein
MESIGANTNAQSKSILVNIYLNFVDFSGCSTTFTAFFVSGQSNKLWNTMQIELVFLGDFFGNLFPLNFSAEALASGLYIIGYEEAARKLLKCFKWGENFFELNREALSLYSKVKLKSSINLFFILVL